jgi:tetratricopeptide (TPR) repeat protein
MKKGLCALFLVAILVMPFSPQAQAASSQEILTQYISDLQKNPSDFALREKIIRYVQTMKPAPAMPLEAEKFEGRAEFAFKNAKSEADFLDAAREYAKALLIAPWAGPYYFNQGLAYEKAGKLAEAKRSFELYLLAVPNAQDARDVRKRIAGLEYATEKAARESSPAAVAAKQQNAEETWLKNLDGARFISPPFPADDRRGNQYLVYYIEGGTVRVGEFSHEPANFKTAPIKPLKFGDGSSSVELKGKQFQIPSPPFVDYRYDTATISNDGGFITFEHAKSVWKRVK